MFKTTVKINGMMCQKNFKTKSVTSSHDDCESVIISAETPDTETLKKVVEETGYEFVSAQTEPYEKKFSLFGKK